jgi:hypothetical protein
MASRPENFGTIEYIEEMDKILDELDAIRRGLGRYDRKERFTITKAMESIRALRLRGKRHGLRLGMIDEDDCK